MYGAGQRGRLKRRELTLTIGSHVRHRGVLHHSRRAGTSHHGRIRSRRKMASLGTHGELLRVIHHGLRLTRRGARLQVRVLLWGGAVESRATSRIGIAISGRIHGWMMMPEPRPGRGRGFGVGDESEAAAAETAGCDSEASWISSGSAAAKVGKGCGHQSQSGRQESQLPCRRQAEL